ncbi:MAG: hypothetical protein ACI9JL_000950 [Paracoccaceae bacterium]|jgi:hypothetical protein
MKLSELRTLAISTSFLVLCAACSSADKDGIDLTTPWLGPLHGFERVGGKEGFGVFLKNTSGATDRFERVVISAPEFIVSAGSDLEAINPAAYEKIKGLFAETFRQELAKQISVANTGAERNSASHLIQVALTNVTVTRKTNSATAATLSDLTFSFEGATVEAEIRVRRSNARRAAIILPANAEKTTWNNLRAQFTDIARRAATEAGKARDAINAKAGQAPPAVKTPAKK